ncbi:unnamed protein product [Schistocephalus solidus]|uniref:KRAB domain-containing protein n=1 Tax=Schistocephalus solidus TaxID=70667 RepID=A0A183SR32_SCHSO|nr:unnamed protein product [Schistocephalus solidus]
MICMQPSTEYLKLSDYEVALNVFGHARLQHQDWFDDNDAAIVKLLAEEIWLKKTYVDHPTDATKAAFY